MTDTVETIQLDKYPNLRARIVIDTDADAPYDDGSAPILRFSKDTRFNIYRAEQVTDVTSYVLPLGITEAAQRFDGETIVFERYLRIFHGTTRVESFGINDTRRTDDDFLAFDTAAWRESVGATVEGIASQDSLMGEYRAYVEGETYGIVVEELQTWARVKDDVAVFQNDDGSDSVREEWAEIDSCYGFYGDLNGYVTATAKDMIEGASA